LPIQGLTLSAVFTVVAALSFIIIVASAFLPAILMNHSGENPRKLLAALLLAAALVALASLRIRRRGGRCRCGCVECRNPAIGFSGLETGSCR
jgi:hypothetical protein